MKRFRVNEPNVVYEAFDEEIVLVNLETGNYYSVRGTGPEIWMALAGGATGDEIAAALGATYDGDANDIARAVEDFAATLVEAELLVEGVNGRTATPPAAPPPAAQGKKGSFDRPVIESYADMQDLLMLDPIHDVDTAGWPVANPG